jgi:hypothetical protein
MFQIPEGAFLIDGYAPNVGAAAAVTGDYISLKNAQMAWVIFQYRQADANAITFQVNKATAVAPTGATVITEAVPIWSNLDTATSNTLVRRTDATTYAAGTGATNKMIVFQIDPSTLGSTYDCIAGYASAVAAAQYLSILYVVLPKFASKVSDQLSFITD